MADTKTPLTRSQFLGLMALTFAIFLIANDFTAFSVALPAMEKEFHSDITTTQWVINGYALVFGVLIISGGRLADMFGRRRMFFLGTFIFCVFSLLGGLAVDISTLLVSRALMGIGAAMIWPAVLGMTYQIMPDDRAGLAGGLIMTVCGIANAIGPLLGGTLTDYLSWRWIFFINLPIAALALFVCWKEIPDERPENNNERIDYRGVASLSLSLFGLLLALDMVVDVGFKSPLIIGLLSGFLIFMAIFLHVEKRAGMNALIPEDVASNRKFFAAGLATLLLSVVFFAALLYIPQFLTKVRDYSAMRAGAGLLPMMVTFGLMSFISGHLYEKLGAKMIVSAGAICLGGGMYLLSHLTKDTQYSSLIFGMVVLGAGIGLFYSTITTAAITVVHPSRASLAGAILYMFQIAGGAIGLGMNTTIVAMAPDIATGIDRAFTVNAYLALAGLIVCLLYVGGERGKPDPKPIQ
ncbi:MFS transporter [Microbulbifer agarilyticus]|uniref:MFS transporter n=1 Tax=Microbulbifer agarilyticus TaxID=260552 RepID=UPI001C95E3EC|nr:MFS transporter [Microbulbifer agarilyticus]MBY6189557.1 MFS transporter [Microbulbifer agarilyticus]